jgi:hypothetical protein
VISAPPIFHWSTEGNRGGLSSISDKDPIRVERELKGGRFILNGKSTAPLGAGENVDLGLWTYKL